ncbi:MAG: hypothetical protein WCF36_06665, partial [Candidatus Nanopelagicales bacterium]
MAGTRRSTPAKATKEPAAPAEPADEATADAAVDEATAGPPSATLEVPVLLDAQGRTWALPAVTALPVKGSVASASLIEAPALTGPVAEAAAELAVGLATSSGTDQTPGRHHVDLAVSPDGEPIGATRAEDAAPLDGWALAEELLGIDLGTDSPRTVPDLGEPTPPMPTGHVVEARLRAKGADPDALLRHLRTPTGPGVRVVAQATPDTAVGSGTVLRLLAHGRDRATALARLQHALTQS